MKNIKEGTQMRVWYEVDVAGKILGRVATGIAQLLMGKGKIDNIPNRDDGDFVVVLNAAEVEVSGKKNKQKEYVRHTGYPGGLRKETFEQLQERYPEKIIIKAVKGMLPKNKLGRRMIKRLKVYPGTEHPHEAQNPKRIEV